MHMPKTQHDQKACPAVPRVGVLSVASLLVASLVLTAGPFAASQGPPIVGGGVFVQPQPLAIEVDAGAFHTCVLALGPAPIVQPPQPNQVICWGWNGMGQAAPYNPGWGQAEPRRLATGSYHTCAVLYSYDVTCWGDNTAGQSNDYHGGDALLVAGGHDHTCALVKDPQNPSSTTVDQFMGSMPLRTGSGNVICWGGNTHGQSDPYLGGDAIQVTAGDGFTCVLTTSGDVHCWGGNWYGQANGYQGGDAIQVDAGSAHVCALLQGGTVECWGNNFDGQADPYTGWPPAFMVTAGGVTAAKGSFGHTCVLVDAEAQTGTTLTPYSVHAGMLVDCWGGNYQLQATDQPLDAVVHEISAGGVHTCALLGQIGSVVCWGDNSFGQSEPYIGIP